MLRINKVTLENYRAYKKEELLFSLEPKKPITIFSGSMSAGKTAIMNALQWCLYGSEPYFLNQGEGKPIIRQKALNDTSVGKSTSASVTVEFSDDGGPRYIIKRTLMAYRKSENCDKKYNKLSGGQVDSGFIFEEKVECTRKKISGGWETTDDVNEFRGYVSKIIPFELSEFVFFNGEMLDTFFRAGGSEKVKTGIERVSGLPVTDRSIDNWKKMSRLYKGKAVRAVGGDTNFIEEAKGTVEAKKAEFVTQKEELLEEIKELIPREKEIKSILHAYPEQYIKHLREELTAEEDHKKDYNKMMSKNLDEKREFLIGNFAAIIVNDTILNAYKILKDSEIRGETPPPINAIFLTERIAEEKCICGNELTNNEDAKKNLQDLLKRVRNSAITNIASEGKETLLSVSEIGKPEDMINKLNALREDYNAFQSKFSRSNEKIDGIISKLKEHPEEKIRSQGIELEEIIYKKDKISDTIAALDVQIESADDVLKTYEGRLTEALKDSKASKNWEAKMNLAGKACKILEELREEILIEIREDVQRRTEEIWRKLISRHWQLDKIVIDENYGIRVLDKEGVDNMRTLSAGQTLYLALSFISAIRDVTDTNYPMVIDSPFGKVSGQERVFAAQDLPNYLPQTQITFLVTDSEYNADVTDLETKAIIPSIKTIFSKNNKIWKEFILKLKKESETSSHTIVEDVLP